MSKLLLTHLESHGVSKVKLLNRGRARAEELASLYPDMEITIGLMDEQWESLRQCDLAFTSTSATGCIVTKQELVEKGWGEAGAGRLAIIDISVPRNVESECNELASVRAYNVDDLKQVVAKNQARRREKVRGRPCLGSTRVFSSLPPALGPAWQPSSASTRSSPQVLEAEVLLRDKLAEFVSWQQSLKYVPAISQLQAKYEAVRAAEVAKAAKKLKGLSDKDMQAVEVLTKGILNKLLHAPMSYLRSEDPDGTKASVRQVNEMFQTGDPTN